MFTCHLAWGQTSPFRCKISNISAIPQIYNTAMCQYITLFNSL